MRPEQNQDYDQDRIRTGIAQSGRGQDELRTRTGQSGPVKDTARAVTHME